MIESYYLCASENMLRKFNMTVREAFFTGLITNTKLKSEEEPNPRVYSNIFNTFAGSESEKMMDLCRKYVVWKPEERCYILIPEIEKVLIDDEMDYDKGSEIKVWSLPGWAIDITYYYYLDFNELFLFTDIFSTAREYREYHFSKERISGIIGMDNKTMTKAINRLKRLELIETVTWNGDELFFISDLVWRDSDPGEYDEYRAPLTRERWERSLPEKQRMAVKDVYRELGHLMYRCRVMEERIMYLRKELEGLGVPLKNKR